MSTYFLPIFTGPLDLLIILVQREEIDISDFSVRTLVEQYLVRREEAPLDEEISSLCDLSQLVYVKIRKLLPQDISEVEHIEEQVVSSDFMQHLVQYTELRQVAHVLSRCEDRALSSYARGVSEEVIPVKKTLRPVSLQEFASCFEKIMQQVERRCMRIPSEVWTVENKMKEIIEKVRIQEMTMAVLFPGEKSREELVVTFLSVLELLKQEIIRLVSDSENGFLIMLRKKNE